MRNQALKVVEYLISGILLLCFFGFQARYIQYHVEKRVLEILMSDWYLFKWVHFQFILFWVEICGYFSALSDLVRLLLIPLLGLPSWYISPFTLLTECWEKLLLIPAFPQELGYYTSFYVAIRRLFPFDWHIGIALRLTPTVLSLFRVPILNDVPSILYGFCVVMKTYPWDLGVVCAFALVFLMGASSLFFKSWILEEIASERSQSPRFPVMIPSIDLRRYTPQQLKNIAAEIQTKLQDVPIIRKMVPEPNCVICFRVQPDVKFNPCGHICMCVKCLNNMNPFKAKKCPLCKNVIQSHKIVKGKYQSEYYLDETEYQREGKELTRSELAKLTDYVRKNKKVLSTLSPYAQKEFSRVLDSDSYSSDLDSDSSDSDCIN